MMVALIDARIFAVEQRTHMHAYTFTKNIHNVHAYLSIWEEFKFSIPSRNSIFQFLLRYCVIAVLWRYLSLLHLQQSKARQRPLTLLRSHMGLHTQSNGATLFSYQCMRPLSREPQMPHQPSRNWYRLGLGCIYV